MTTNHCHTTLAVKCGNMSPILCTFLLILSIRRASADLTKEVTLQTTLGEITGTELEISGIKVQRFLGIPYAKPPKGALRFAKPQRYGSFNGKRLRATEFAPFCVHLTLAADQEVKGKEDCLYLNVYTRNTTDPKPILIFIHGGSFLDGSSDLYPSESIVAHEEVVVVTINYRLNIFGFLTTGDARLPGNYGLWDQRLAIEWVKDNIQSYGGDPSSITLFGESAGGRAILFHMLSPQNNASLFQRAITQSGSALSITFMNRDPTPVLHNITSGLGCPPSDDNFLACLRSLPVRELANSGQLTNRPFPFYPIVDGDYLPFDLGVVLSEFTRDGVSAEVLRRSGNFVMYDLLSGWNDQEGLMYVNQLSNVYSETVSEGISRELLTKVLAYYPFYNYGGSTCSKQFVIDLLIDFYMRTNEELNSDGRSVNERRLEIYTEIAGDVALKLPTIQHLQLHTAFSKRNTYAYEFSHKRANFPPLWYQGPDWLRTGTDHAEELPFVFGYPLLTKDESSRILLSAEFWDHNTSYTDLERELSKRVMRQWATFAKTGDLSDEGYLPFEFPLNQSYARLRTGGQELSTFPLEERQRLWSAIDSAVINCNSSVPYSETPSSSTPSTSTPSSSNTAFYLNGLVTLTPAEANHYLIITLIFSVLLATLVIILTISLVSLKFKIKKKSK